MRWFWGRGHRPESSDVFRIHHPAHRIPVALREPEPGVEPGPSPYEDAARAIVLSGPTCSLNHQNPTRRSAMACFFHAASSLTLSLYTCSGFHPKNEISSCRICASVYSSTSRRSDSNRLSPHYKCGAGPDLLRRQDAGCEGSTDELWGLAGRILRGAFDGIRTHTGCLLKTVPLPLGYEDMLCALRRGLEPRTSWFRARRVYQNSTNGECRSRRLSVKPCGHQGLVFTTELSRTDRDRPCAYLLKSDQVGCVGLNSNFILASASE